MTIKKTPRILRRDPHLAHVVCLNQKCKHTYTVAPVTWTFDGGYYSSDRDFCVKCGGGELDVSYPWLVSRTKAQRARMMQHLNELSKPQMRLFILAIYNALWNPPDKDWSADTLDEIVAVFQAHALDPTLTGEE